MEWLRKKLQDIRIKNKRKRSNIQKIKCTGVGMINIFPSAFLYDKFRQFLIQGQCRGPPWSP